MKKLSNIFLPMLVLATLLISACTGAAPADNSGAGKVQASPVEFTGMIESMNGNEWVINGQTILVDPALVSDGSFSVGDNVRVEVEVAEDGTLTMQSIQPSSADDNSNDANVNSNGNSNSNDNSNGNSNSNGNENSNGNSNDDNSNDGNSNDDNSNDDNGNGNSNDDNSNDDNGNDDNSNDDNGNDDNSNDDNSNDDSGNDDNSNDDNSNGG